MSIGSIYVDLLLNDGKFSAGWGRARGATRTAVGAIQGDISKLSGSLASLTNPLASVAAAVQQLGASMVAALSVEKVIKYSDTWKQTVGRLSLVSSGMDDVTTKQEQLFRIAQETRQPLNDIINFYTRLNQFIPEAERNQYDLLGVTQSVASALAITGESAISAQAALIQFTQGIGTNFEAAGQELRSLQELAPRLTQALQASLGDGKKSLQELVKAGTLTRSSVLSALSGMGVEGRKLKEEMAKIPTTVAQSFTQLDNALLKFLGSSDSVSQSTSALATAVKALADNLDPLARAFITVAAVVGGASILKFATSAVTAGVALAQTADKAAKAAAALGAFRAASTAVTGATKVFTLSGVVVKTVEAAVLGLRGAFLSLSAAMGGPLVIAATAAYAALEIFADKNKAIAGEEAFRKAIADTSTEFAGFAKQSKESQATVLAASDARINKTQEELRVWESLLRKQEGMSTAAKIISGTVGTLGDWSGKDLSGIDPFGVGYTEDQLKGLVAEAENSLQRMKEIRDSATNLIKVEGTGYSFTKDELKDFVKVKEDYEAAIRGVSEAQVKYDKEMKRLAGALAIGPEEGGISKAQYESSAAFLKKQLEEASPAFKEAKKNTEELKSFYEKLRPSILGISKAQDTYNQTMIEADRLLAARKINAEAYNRIQQDALAVREDTAAKEKENQSIYDKYETYLTGITEKQLQYNKAREELQGIVGKKTESGEIVTQTQADTALDKYRQHLEDSEKDTLEWSKMVSKMGEKAAENIQDAFAEFLYEPFKNGLDGMANDFQNVIRKMAAELLASQLFKLLKSEIFDIGGTTKIDTSGGKGQAASSGTSLLGDLGSWFAGLFADGGFISPGKWGVVGEEGAEVVYGGNTGASVIPQEKLRVSGGGSTVLNMNIYAADADSFNRSRKQVAASGMQMLQMASQRNG